MLMYIHSVLKVLVHFSLILFEAKNECGW